MPEPTRRPEFSELPESALDDSKSPGSGSSPVTSPANPVSKNPTPVSPQTLSEHVFRSFSAVPPVDNKPEEVARRASESTFTSRQKPVSSLPSHMARVVSGSHGGAHSVGTLTPDTARRDGASGQAIKGKGKVLSIKERLKTEEHGVVKRRDGGVLARGFILKTDHYPTGNSAPAEIVTETHLSLMQDEL
jgi:hypothetical protein